MVTLFMEQLVCMYFLKDSVIIGSDKYNIYTPEQVNFSPSEEILVGKELVLWV